MLSIFVEGKRAISVTAKLWVAIGKACDFSFGSLMDKTTKRKILCSAKKQSGKAGRAFCW